MPTKSWWHAEIESKVRAVTMRRARRKEGPPPAPRIGLSEKTGRNHLDALGVAFALAVEREWLEANPIDAFRASRRPRGRTLRRLAERGRARDVAPALVELEEERARMEAAGRRPAQPAAGVDLVALAKR